MNDLEKFVVANTGCGNDDWVISGTEDELVELLKLARLGLEYFKYYRQYNAIRYATNDVSDFMAGIGKRGEK